ncbi:hypothetical protein GCM10009688_13240 [Arthrobacter gandavensis]|uniref:Uncharacterized protein n=1 Tax=Arthrobacter gandavensis TaxID=169960 RepID=A0ABN2P1J8_9MICC
MSTTRHDERDGARDRVVSCMEGSSWIQEGRENRLRRCTPEISTPFAGTNRSRFEGLRLGPHSQRPKTGIRIPSGAGKRRSPVVCMRGPLYTPCGEESGSGG